MLKTLDITIKSAGHAKGTVGWLAEQAHGLTIARTKDGCEGVWLVDKSGGTITALAIRGYWYKKWPEIETIACDRTGVNGPGAVDIPWTDAAWRAVCDLGERAKTILEAKVDHDDSVGTAALELPRSWGVQCSCPYCESKGGEV